MRLVWPLGLALILGMILMAAPGHAEQRRLEITGGTARVRDLLPAGKLLEEARDAVIAEGLRPGEERHLTTAELKLRLTGVGIDGAIQSTQPIVIRRRSRTLLASELLAAGEKAIREALNLAPGDEATLSPVVLPRSLLAPVTPLTVEALVRRPALPGGLWVASITARSDDWTVESTIRFRVRVTGSVLVTRRAVKREDSLSEADVDQERREITGQTGDLLRKLDDILGRRAKRAVPAGAVVSSDWLEVAPVVRRGDVIRVVVQIGAISASVQVVALASGGPGEVIRVREEMSKCEFSARVAAPGRVEVAP